MCLDTCGTGVMRDGRLPALVGAEFDARPAAIIEQLDLRRPIYTATSAYGHFGDPRHPWERIDRVGALEEAAAAAA